MPSLKREIGNEGEKIAKKYLRGKGYYILETNYLKPFGEIDIIAENQGRLVFVEVKTIFTPYFTLRGKLQNEKAGMFPIRFFPKFLKRHLLRRGC